ncbi:MAG: hypothetical protein LBG58_03515 [Planctomycetaceae bacterium]|jgi:hypothetical protein|nr:hypothetical protein [Planctomycetaceae bacterium]
MFHSPLIYCPFRALMVLTITRRVAAGWLVLPFHGERTTVLIDLTIAHKRKTLPVGYRRRNRSAKGCLPLLGLT